MRSRSRPELPQFEILEEETSLLEIGPPVVLTTTVSSVGRKASIELVLTGRGGERYRADVLRNGKRIDPPPKLKILDQNGKVLESGSFKYG
jgi:hypothetical protein